MKVRHLKYMVYCKPAIKFFHVACTPSLETFMIFLLLFINKIHGILPKFFICIVPWDMFSLILLFSLLRNVPQHGIQRRFAWDLSHINRIVCRGPQLELPQSLESTIPPHLHDHWVFLGENPLKPLTPDLLQLFFKKTLTTWILF